MNIEENIDQKKVKLSFIDILFSGISLRGLLVAFFVITSVILFKGFLDRKEKSYDSLNLKIEKIPDNFGSWSRIDSTELDARSKSILSLDQSLKRTYKNHKGEKVSLYIGYWKKQTGDKQAGKHSPILCLPANGWKISSPVNMEVQATAVSPKFIVSNLTGETSRENVFFTYWFFRGNEMFADETQALFKTTLGLIFGKRADGGIVEISVELSKDKHHLEAEIEAKEVVLHFIRDFVPEFYRLLSD